MVTGTRVMGLCSLILATALCAPANAVEASAVKRAVDKAANWIVEQYDVKEKSFKTDQGKDVTTVAMIVYALCREHRDYKEANGPFISEPVKFLVAQLKEDGSFQNAGLNNSAAAVWVKRALTATKNSKYADLVKQIKTPEPVKPEKAELSGGDLKKALLFAIDELAALKGDEAKVRANQLAEELVKLQQKNGSFGDSLQVNALAVELYNLCYLALK